MSLSISTSFCSCFPPRWVMFSLHSILLIHNYTSCWLYTTRSFRPAIQQLANERSIANELWVDGSPHWMSDGPPFLMFMHVWCATCYLLGAFSRLKWSQTLDVLGSDRAVLDTNALFYASHCFTCLRYILVVILVATASKGRALKWSKQGETFRSEKQLKWLATNFVATNCCTLFIGVTHDWIFPYVWEELL